MQDVKILYSLESYQRDNGLISDFGEIYLQVENYFFPEAHWTDFGCKCVYIWAEEIISLLTTRETKVECNFYDGAFLFYVAKSHGNLWEITLVNEDSDKEFECKYFVDPIQTSSNLLEAIRFMQAIYYKQGNVKGVKYNKERELDLENAIKSFQLI
jgi:hypothetical protein